MQDTDSKCCFYEKHGKGWWRANMFVSCLFFAYPVFAAWMAVLIDASADVVTAQWVTLGTVFASLVCSWLIYSSEKEDHIHRRAGHRHEYRTF